MKLTSLFSHSNGSPVCKCKTQNIPGIQIGLIQNLANPERQHLVLPVLDLLPPIQAVKWHQPPASGGHSIFDTRPQILGINARIEDDIC